MTTKSTNNNYSDACYLQCNGVCQLEQVQERYSCSQDMV